jgi:hypothetical protein
MVLDVNKEQPKEMGALRGPLRMQESWVPINDTLYGVLKSLPVHLGTDLVFPEITGLQLTVAFRRACKRVGIKDFRFHDLSTHSLRI